MNYSVIRGICAIIMGLLLSYGTYLILSRLCQIDNETLCSHDLIGCEGKIIVTIFEQGIGSVSLNTKNGKITYQAQSDHYIAQGTIVKIIDIKKSTLIVSDSPIYFLNQ